MKDTRIAVRCTEQFKEQAEENARSLGLNLSAYVKMLIQLDTNKLINESFNHGK